MMNDAIKDKGREKEEEDRKKGKGKRNRGLDQAEGGEEERDGGTVGF